MTELIEPTDHGFYCVPGDFFIDPYQPVEHAVITHLHGDHYAYNCGSYIVSEESRYIAQIRLGQHAPIMTKAYRQPFEINGVTVSLHPAGHILGSSQVRVAYQGEVWVVSGDYKREPDPTCTPFEVVECDVFITEATFGLPIYRWEPQAAVFDRINAWWRENAQQGKASVILGYALGKALRGGVGRWIAGSRSRIISIGRISCAR